MAKDNILFLPGLNCTASLFKPQIDELSQSYSCFVGDHGTANSMDEIVRNILARAPERFNVIGLSMGGYLAFEIMRQQPERVISMVLLDTRSSLDTAEDAERRRRTIEIVERGQFNVLHSILWPRLVHSDRVADCEIESIVKKMMQDTGKERFIRQQTAILNRPNYLTTLASITVPVLVGVGKQDVITPPEMAQDIVSNIKGSELQIYEECGHLSTLEKPEIITRKIKDFLYQKVSVTR